MTTPKVAVVTFPGSNDDRDALRAIRHMGAEGVPVWHRETGLRGADAVLLPGGFAYGDYLRTGAIAAFAPIMDAVRAHAEAGRPVLGVCNGFQILCEAQLLPGALIRNRTLTFVHRRVFIRVETTSTPFTAAAEVGNVLEVPIKHGEGQYVADETTLDRLEAEGQLVFRYCTPTGEITDDANPNGAMRNIAGVRNERGNVVGLMPHPEHAVDPDVGPVGGQTVFASLLSSLVGAAT